MTKVTKFWAGWCQPCKNLSPVIDSVKREFPNVEFVEVDIDANPEVAQANHVRNIPLVIIEGPNGTQRFPGMNSATTYVEAIRQAG